MSFSLLGYNLFLVTIRNPTPTNVYESLRLAFCQTFYNFKSVHRSRLHYPCKGTYLLNILLNSLKISPIVVPFDHSHFLLYLNNQNPMFLCDSLEPTTDASFVRPARQVCSLTDTTNQNKNAMFCVVYSMRRKNDVTSIDPLRGSI